MAGGIIQLTTFGAQNLFLTGVPEITFFKVVYRRHTNFSIEQVKVNFDDTTEFGSSSVIKIPKIGDLLHKMYLEIILPKIDLQKDNIHNYIHLQKEVNEERKKYEIIINFMRINRWAFVEAYHKYIAENNQSLATKEMIKIINQIFSNHSHKNVINEMKNLLNTTDDDDLFFKYKELSMEDIANTFSENTDKNELYKALSRGIDKSIKTQKFFFQKLNKAIKKLQKESNPNINFAWVDKIGHSIIESIEIKIGGQKIDKHYGDWLNIWHELTANKDMESIYNKMIGNVPILTTFDNNTKPQYHLRIPLQFWFCRFSGNSLPLITLEHQNVTMHVKFRKFEEISYMERDVFIKHPTIEGGITLDEVPDEMNINMHAYMMVDYIFLDNLERKRFAQSMHEYLIEQVQILEKTNITQQKIQLQLNNFVNPTKELIWVSQRDSFIQNLDFSNKCRWDNYTFTEKNDVNPIIFSNIDFHSYNRTLRLDGNYYNYVQPYETHTSTPSAGINMYSFSFFPEEHQPSGSVNIGNLSRVTMYLEFDHELFADNINLDTLTVRVYARSLNIIRFVNGFAGLSWTS